MDKFPPVNESYCGQGYHRRSSYRLLTGSASGCRHTRGGLVFRIVFYGILARSPPQYSSSAVYTAESFDGNQKFRLRGLRCIHAFQRSISLNTLGINRLSTYLLSSGSG